MTTTDTPVRLAVRASGDRKVTPLIRVQSSKQAPVLLNSFGLPARRSCVGMTAFCDVCYADEIQNLFTNVGKLMDANWDALAAAGDNIDAIIAAVDPVVTQYHTKFDKMLAAGRVAPADDIFRWHWNGDYYSAAYATAIDALVGRYARTQFWSYTRSFEFVPILVGRPNHAIYLSIDQYNIDRAAPLLDAYPDVHAAFCADTIADCQVLADKLDRRPAPCPELLGQLPLVVDRSGRRSITVNVGDDAQGACSACGLCVYGRRDVSFASKHR